MGELESNAARAFRAQREKSIDNVFKALACTVIFAIASQTDVLPDSEQYLSGGLGGVSLVYAMYSFARAISAERSLRRELAPIEQPALD